MTNEHRELIYKQIELIKDKIRLFGLLDYPVINLYKAMLIHYETILSLIDKQNLMSGVFFSDNYLFKADDASSFIFKDCTRDKKFTVSFSVVKKMLLLIGVLDLLKKSNLFLKKSSEERQFIVDNINNSFFNSSNSYTIFVKVIDDPLEVTFEFYIDEEMSDLIALKKYIELNLFRENACDNQFKLAVAKLVDPSASLINGKLVTSIRNFNVVDFHKYVLYALL